MSPSSAAQTTLLAQSSLNTSEGTIAFTQHSPIKLSAASSSIDDVPLMPSFGSPHDRFTVTFAGHEPLKIRVPDVSQGPFAHRLWRAGFLLARAVFSGDEIDVRGKTVCELGCGIALPGIAASLRGASFTAMTDYDDPKLLRDIEENLRAAPTERGRARVIGHTWGRSIDDLIEADPATEDGYDILLAADVCWDEFAQIDLVKSVNSLLARRPSARFHLIAGFHSGRRTLARFFERIEARGLKIDSIVERRVTGQTIEDCAWSPEERPWSATTRMDEPIEQRNRWLVRAVIRHDL